MEKKSFFYDEKGIIKEELLTTDALDLAREFKNRHLNPAQLRRFYHDAKALEARVNSRVG